jgi:collagenase-like PrtC family protease
MLRNIALGHFYNEPFVEACTPWKDRIREVFFAWPGVLSCRPAPEFTDEVRSRLFSDLRWCKENGILLDTLFNCNCYGDNAISTELADFVESNLREMNGYDLFPDIVTTTSPFIATILRQRFPQVKIRWSVNGRVHGTTGYEYITELFDSFYMSREMQRDIEEVKRTSQWARENGKIIGMQVNSGCLRQCPFQQFHDNLHGHNRIRQSGIGANFDFSVFRCRTTYGRKNFEAFLKSTWIRPEDVPYFEPYIDVIKLATRRIKNPTTILNAYASYSFDGNLLDLMDPIHSDLFAPKIIDNKSFPEDWITSGIGGACANNCSHCGRCSEVLSRVLKERGNV